VLTNRQTIGTRTTGVSLAGPGDRRSAPAAAPDGDGQGKQLQKEVVRGVFGLLKKRM
jgi:hypothetical protein